MTHNEIVKNFAERKINRKWGTVQWKGSRISCEGGVIKSYHWWPMAYYLGMKKGQHFFLKQGDRYSSSTTGHQGLVQSYCKGATVSFSALSSAGVDASQLRLENILSIQDDFMESWLIKRKVGGKWKYFKDTGEAWTPPNQGMFIAIERISDTEVSGYWHILGGVLFNIGSRYLLCGIDDGTYFVIELPKKAKNINHAFQILKPRPVVLAENQGISVKRQGEWFFIPTGMDDTGLAKELGVSKTKLRKIARQFELPSQDNQSNRHVAIIIDRNLKYFELVGWLDRLRKKKDELREKYNDLYLSWIKRIYLKFNPDKSESPDDYWFESNAREFMKENYNEAMEAKRKRLTELWQDKNLKLADKIDAISNKLKSRTESNIKYARGNVYHRNPITGRNSREHQTLKLGSEWHRVVRNTEIASWSMGGKFD